MMKFSEDTLAYLKSISEQAKEAASILGVSDITAQGILGAIGEEYESLGVVDIIQAERVATFTHDAIRDNFALMRDQPHLLKDVVTAGLVEKALLKWNNVALNDVGPGNIKIHSAINLLNDYIESNPHGDPLGLKKYSTNYADMVKDLSNENNSLSLKFAGLMLKQGSDLYREKTPGVWDAYDQNTKDAILITYYNNGREKSLERIENANGSGIWDYFPGPGGGTSGGLIYLENVDTLKVFVGAASSGIINNDFELKIDNPADFEYNKPYDPQAVIDEVAQGIVAKGGTWKINYDYNKLNFDQYTGNWIDNTFAGAASRVLADGWRPGNGNLARDLFDYSLLSAISGKKFWNWSSEMAYMITMIERQARGGRPIDPLVLDLNGDGVHLSNYLENPVFFDIDNDGGSLEQTGWASAEDGFAVVDLNGNGKIDNVAEMLSEYFGGAAGTEGHDGEKRFKNGFDALKSLDSNGDGVFDQRDDAWSSVKIWVDANQDGKSWVDSNNNNVRDAGEASELKSLEELGISQINLDHEVQNGEVRDGNEVLAQGSFVRHCQSFEAIAANFMANPLGHSFSVNGNGGIVTSEGDEQVSTILTYVVASDVGEHVDLAEKGVNNATGGKGNDVLLGDAGTNWLAGGQGSDTFYGGDGDDVLLIDAQDLQSNIHGGNGTDIVQVLGDEGVTLNLAQAGVEIAQGGRGNDVFIGGGTSTVYMRGGDGDDMLIGGAANDALSGENGDDLIDGGAGNDVLRGHRGQDQILGGLGDDLIDGGLDDDWLSGGAGDDVLIGGAGDDTIDGGDGVDVIELSGSFSEYRVTKTVDGIWISDTVAGRDGTDFVRNVEKANFKDVGRVDIPSNVSEGLDNPMPVNDVLSHDQSGSVLDRSKPYLIGKEQLLANDIDWQGDALHISGLFEVVGGTAQLTEHGDVLFTPDPGFSGFMGFKYSVMDAKGNSAPLVVDADGNAATLRGQVVLKTAELPADPLLTEQWHLAQANILPVWKDYSGKGVRIGMFEPSGEFSTSKEIFDYRHADLKANVDQHWLANATPGQLAGDGSEGRFSNHATMVAGIMVAAKNGEGGVGVAYDATLAGYWTSSTDRSNLAHMREYDVVNHSWGSPVNFDAQFKNPALGNMVEAYSDARSLGRNGLGTVIVTGAGNGRATGGNTNYSIWSNARNGIIVGAINDESDLSILQLGRQPFSTPGASILVSAPGSNISSTSRLQQNENGSVFGSDASVAAGTSFATPIVAGIVALMLEANPLLGYRDVQEILALSARKVNDPNTVWNTNGSSSWNGGGMHVSHDYGYGGVDALAAVRLAETWIRQETAANECSLALPKQSGELNLALEQPMSEEEQAWMRDYIYEQGLENEVDWRTQVVGYTSSTLGGGDADLRTEFVEVRVRLTHERPGDLTIYLFSPSGTRSVLMDRPGKTQGDDTSLGDASFNGSNTLDYVFSTALLRGENPNGSWYLEVVDSVAGGEGTLHEWSMNVYGSGNTVNDQYVYTDDYAQLAVEASSDGMPKRNVLNDTDGGIDTINVAAVSSGSRVDLTAGSATIDGAHLTVEHAEGIENILGGGFNDQLIGNAAENILRGGRGDDRLEGRAGQDTLDGGHGNDSLTGGVGADLFVLIKDPGAMDTIVDFESLSTDGAKEMIALVGFGNLTFGSLTKHQIGPDVLLDLGNGQALRLLNVRLEDLSADQFGFFANQSELNQWQTSDALRRYGTTADDTLWGGNADELLLGRSGDDWLSGGAGDDVLIGGQGLDTLEGGLGNDVVTLDGDRGYFDFRTFEMYQGARTGGAGADRFVVLPEAAGTTWKGLTGGVGAFSDNLVGDFELEADRIDFSQFDWLKSFEQLTISSSMILEGRQVLTGVTAKNGDEVIYIGLVNVVPELLNASHFIFAGSADATLMPVDDQSIAGASASQITGVGPALEMPGIFGTAVNDVLVGDAGGNLIDGGLGADRMEGRTGDDTYRVNNELDVVVEVIGGGYDLVQSSVSYSLATEVESLELMGNQAINGAGNAQANRIVGNAAANVLDGAAGADLLVGKDGNDTYIVDDTADRVVEQAGEGIDTVRSSISFTLGNHLEHLELTGSAAINGTGNDLDNHLTGNSAANRLLGGAGNDRLDGRSGTDTLIGGGGNDTYLFGRGYGTDTVTDIDATTGNSDQAVFLEGIAVDQLWFSRAGNSLDISVIGTSDKLVIKDWYVSSANHVESFKTSDGKTLMDSQVQNLVNALAAFAPPGAGQITLPQNYQSALSSAIAVNWA